MNVPAGGEPSAPAVEPQAVAVPLVRIAAWGDNGYGQSEAPSGTYTRVSASRTNSYAVLTPFCGADLDGSSMIDLADVALLLLDFGPCSRCAADLDASGMIDLADVALVLLDFGPC